ncbi:MAG: hypothetical protein ACI8XV_002712 [Arenicella sp.]|jgi:hypothetical protein
MDSKFLRYLIHSGWIERPLLGVLTKKWRHIPLTSTFSTKMDHVAKKYRSMELKEDSHTPALFVMVSERLI